MIGARVGLVREGREVGRRVVAEAVTAVVGFNVFAIVAVGEDATVGFEDPAAVGTVPAVVGLVVPATAAVGEDATVGFEVPTKV